MAAPRASFRRVLCATDFSRQGDAAARVAARLSPSTLHLVHVRHPAFVLSPMDASPAFVLPPWDPKAEVAAERRDVARLERLARPRAGMRVRAHVSEGPDTAAAIVRLARAERVDAIVVGTHGRAALGRLLLGSVAAKVARLSPVPVVLVHPGGRARSRAARAPSRSKPR
jgi:nucleotide-binding universal stress UspA family protein